MRQIKQNEKQIKMQGCGSCLECSAVTFLGEAGVANDGGGTAEAIVGDGHLGWVQTREPSNPSQCLLQISYFSRTHREI